MLRTMCGQHSPSSHCRSLSLSLSLSLTHTHTHTHSDITHHVHRPCPLTEPCEALLLKTISNYKPSSEPRRPCDGHTTASHGRNQVESHSQTWNPELSTPGVQGFFARPPRVPPRSLLAQGASCFWEDVFAGGQAHSQPRRRRGSRLHACCTQAALALGGDRASAVTEETGDGEGTGAGALSAGEKGATSGPKKEGLPVASLRTHHRS